MNDKLLCDATVQDIQLELIRRRSFNQFKGEQIVKSLLANRDLWIAVLMDGLVHAADGELASSGLIKLRDLPGNRWNVDTLFIMAPNAEVAQELAELAEKDNWRCDEVVVDDDPQVVGRALGAYPPPAGAIVQFWWD